MLKIGSVRWKGRCSRHSRYNPELDGQAGIVGGCRRCEMLLTIFQHHSAMVRLIREFGTREDAKSKAPPAEDRQMLLLE